MLTKENVFLYIILCKKQNHSDVVTQNYRVLIIRGKTASCLVDNKQNHCCDDRQWLFVLVLGTHINLRQTKLDLFRYG